MQNIQEALRGVHYPAKPEDILAHAKQNGAADDMITLLRQLPERPYKNKSDVNHTLGQIEDRDGLIP